MAEVAPARRPKLSAAAAAARRASMTGGGGVTESVGGGGAAAAAHSSRSATSINVFKSKLDKLRMQRMGQFMD